MSSSINPSNARLVCLLCNLRGAEFGGLAHPPNFGYCFFCHGDRFTDNLESQSLKATVITTNMYFTRDAETLKIIGSICSYKTSRTRKLKNSKKSQLTDFLTARLPFAAAGATITWSGQLVTCFSQNGFFLWILTFLFSKQNLNENAENLILTFSLLAAVCLAATLGPSLADVFHLKM